MRSIHSRGRHRLLAAAVTLVLAVGLIVGIGGALAASESPSPADGKVVLRLGWLNEADSLNPFVGYELSSYEVWALNYDLLVGYDTGGSPAPGLAESWEVSDDGLVWTFKIRQGMKWQDGEPITAADVAFTYNLIIEKDLTAVSSYTKNIKEAKVVDDYTVDMVVLGAQGQHGTRLDLHHARAHLEQDQGSREVPDGVPLRRLGTLPVPGMEAGQPHQDDQEPGLLGARADDRRDLLRLLHQRRHDDPGPQVRPHRRRPGGRAGAVSTPSRDRLVSTPSPTTSCTGSTSASTAPTRRSTRRRRAIRCCRTSTSATR